MAINLTVNPSIKIWYSKPQDLVMIFIQFSDQTEMRIEYKNIKKGILQPSIVKYENQVVDGITADLTVTDFKKFKWILQLAIPEMNLDEQINFVLINIKNEGYSLISSCNLKQTLNIKKSSLQTQEVLSKQEEEKREEKTRQAHIKFRRDSEEGVNWDKFN